VGASGLSAPFDAVEVGPARGAADGTVVLFHGLGADGHDFESLVPEIEGADGHLRWLFPHAPVRPVTLNGGHRMRAWFDIVAIDRRARQDLDGLRESAALAHALVRREESRGIPPDRVVLAGFSQGGSVALFGGLRFERRLAGLVALSTWMPGAERLADEAHPANAAVPVFMAHGAFDSVVVPALAGESRDALLAAGHEVTFRTYPMAHTVSASEVADLRAWLDAVLPRRS
jgi:phospholipase/carboxylesterase